MEHRDMTRGVIMMRMLGLHGLGARTDGPSRSRSERLRPLQPTTTATFAVLAALCVWGSAGAVNACWLEEALNLRQQMALTTKWGVIQVRNLRFGGVGTDDPETWVDFAFVDVNGNATGTGTLWHWGADVDGGTIRSTSPRLKIGAYYVVLLRTTSHGMKLVHEAASALRVENLTAGALSPWDSVHFLEGHKFVPPGQSRTVSDAQLHEVVDGLAALETDLKARGGAP